MADFGISEALAALGVTTAAETAGEAAAGAAATAAAIETPELTAAVLPEVAGAGTSASLSSYLPSLGTVGTAASVAGTGLTARAGLSNAEYQQAVARAEAQQLQDKANQETAAGEQSAIQRQRQSDFLLSRGQAVAAASGAGATDPTVLDVEGTLAEQGRYNALTGIYEGQAAARSDAQQAAIDLFRGRQIGAAAPIAATGTILSGLSSFADKRARLRYFTTTGDVSANSGL